MRFRVCLCMCECEYIINKLSHFLFLVTSCRFESTRLRYVPPCNPFLYACNFIPFFSFYIFSFWVIATICCSKDSSAVGWLCCWKQKFWPSFENTSTFIINTMCLPLCMHKDELWCKLVLFAEVLILLCDMDSSLWWMMKIIGFAADLLPTRC